MSKAPKIVEAERAYTIPQAAEIKGVSPDTIRRAIKATHGHSLAAKFVGREYRISASALEAWWDGLEDA